MEMSLHRSLVAPVRGSSALGIQTKKYTAAIHNNAPVSRATSEGLSAKGSAAFATAGWAMSSLIHGRVHQHDEQQSFHWCGHRAR
jgi:hypothetical protein